MKNLADVFVDDDIKNFINKCHDVGFKFTENSIYNGMNTILKLNSRFDIYYLSLYDVDFIITKEIYDWCLDLIEKIRVNDAKEEVEKLLNKEI
jgi:hypothetical protein